MKIVKRWESINYKVNYTTKTGPDKFAIVETGFKKVSAKNRTEAIVKTAKMLDTGEKSFEITDAIKIE